MSIAGRDLVVCRMHIAGLGLRDILLAEDAYVNLHPYHSAIDLSFSWDLYMHGCTWQSFPYRGVICCVALEFNIYAGDDRNIQANNSYFI